MDTERRLLLALFLSTAVLLFAPYLLSWLSPPPPPQPEVPIEEMVAAEPAAEESPEVMSAQEEVEPAVSAQPATQATPRTVEVVNEQLQMRWTNVGARPESVQLRDYLSRDGTELELIPQVLPPGIDRPLAIRLDDADLNEELKGAVFELEAPPGDRIVGPAELVFRYRSALLDVVRRVRIPASGYLLEVEHQVRLAGRRSPFSVVLGPAIGRSVDQVEAGFFAVGAGDFAFPGITLFRDDGAERFYAGDVDPQVVPGAGLRWVAFDSQYFSYVLLGGEAGIDGARVDAPFWPEPEGGETTVRALASAAVRIAQPGEVWIFFGPKDLEELRAIDPTLGELVDYGWFAILVKPLLFVLKQIYSLIGNYGWAIILLTFLINLALFPVRYKQMSSMKKMSELQPKLKAIQNRYAKLPRDDPKRQDMNREVMALYQQHGVNPLGGCLPLLLQMPFLFAFYRMLASSIELRGAPFMLWINDLSRPDPYYVTPIVMGATMVAQQQMTPATGDPAQRRMMMLMPIVFTFLFLSVSSGLALYFLFSNVFGMLLQWGMQKFQAEKEEAGPSTPKKQKKRKRK